MRHWSALPEQRRRGEQDREHRQRQDEVGDAHQQVVEPAAVVAGDRADDEPDDRRDDGDEDADLHRGADPVDDAAELVAADLVGAEKWCPDHVGACRMLLRSIWSNVYGAMKLREDPRAEDDDQADQPAHREPVPEEAHARIRPLAPDLELEAGLDRSSPTGRRGAPAGARLPDARTSRRTSKAQS